MSFDIDLVRKDFPVLDEILEDGNKLVYFDNGATAQKPSCVIDALNDFYTHKNANIHRGSHELARRSTIAFEEARKKAADFFNADESFSTVFTHGATESLNIIAHSWGGKYLNEGDEVILSMMEHHANIVPWQILAEKKKIKIKVANITDEGELDYDQFESLFSDKTKIVSITQASNVLGTINDIKKISKICRKKNVLLSIDAAQSSPHFIADLKTIDCDFMSLSAHKCFGPTGLGLLFGKEKILNRMDVWMGGGDMIENVSWENTTFRASPARFEAGTPNIADAAAFGTALHYLSKLDKKAVHEHEQKLLRRMTELLMEVDGLKILGSAKEKLPIVTFAVDGVHPHDISAMLDASGIAVREGHHCAEPLMTRLGVKSSCRASIAFYNTIEEVEFFAKKLKSCVRILK